MQLYRIYCDGNAVDERGRFDLGIRGSLRDIEPIADKLQEGMRVVLNMEDEIEMEATLEFDPKHNQWWAQPIKDTKKHRS